MLEGGADSGHSQSAALPQLGLINFRHGHIESIADPFLQTLDDVALGLERTAFGQVDLYLTCQQDQCLPGLTIIQTADSFYDFKDLDYILFLNIAEAFNSDAAFIPFQHLPHIVLEASK